MSKPIRVLQVVTHMNRGGLETMLMNYYRNIDRNKIQFDFLTHRNDAKKDYDDEIESLGGKIYHVSALNPFSLNYRKELKKFFSEHPEYSIVHSHLDCMSAIPLKYAKQAGVKNRIAHSHSTSQDKNIKFLLKKIYKNFIPKQATHLLSCSTEAGKWMFNGNKFTVLNNAIDAKKFQYNKEVFATKKKELGLEDCFVIGHVGRFNEPKNHTFIIDVFNEVAKQDETARLVLVGTGDLMENVRSKVNSLNLNDKVIFLGLRSDIAELMQAMDVFLFPSVYEGLPVTLVEAQAAGLPCIISDRISTESMITENITMMSLETPLNKWCSNVLSYKNYDKEDTFNQISEAGFDINENAKKLEEMYLEML